MATSKNKYWIGRRDNPQLKKPYYRGYGQLSKTAALKKEGCLYGRITVIPYDTKDEYNTELERLRNEGFTVYVD